MKTMAITKFKTHAFKLIDEVAQSQKSIIITKQGKAIAKIVPFTEADNIPLIILLELYYPIRDFWNVRNFFIFRLFEVLRDLFRCACSAVAPLPVLTSKNFLQ